jgi:hypothetical protein
MRRSESVAAIESVVGIESLVAIKGGDLESFGEKSLDTSSMRRVKSSKSCFKKLGATNHSSCSSLPTFKRNVSFHQIEINQFPIEIGDNPCADGVPIQIGWLPDQTDVFDFELYESSKMEPRDRHEFHMPAEIRQAMLFSNGAKTQDMVDAIREVKKIKKSRVRSIKNRKWDSFNYSMESARRKLKKVASLPSLTSAHSHHHYPASPGSNGFDVEEDGPITF